MKENIPQPKQAQMQKDYYGDWPDPKHNYYLRSVKLSEVQKARRTDPNAYKGFEAGEPTGTTFAIGGNIRAIVDYLKRPTVGLNIPNPKTKDIKNAISEDFSRSNYYSSKGLEDMHQQNNNNLDFSRYAPVGANMAVGISDLFETPENVKYNRVDPELIKSRMDYQPIDTD